MAISDMEARLASVSLRQLRLFEAVGRLASVRRGSEECNLSQPAVTQAIAKLELQIGETLFRRLPNGSYLTGAGTILHQRTSRMFGHIETALLDLGVAGGAANAQLIANRLTRSQVDSLIAIIEYGTFDRAAAALDMTRASLQRAARNLENNLRKLVYCRTSAGLVVTPDGIEFGRKLKLALQEIQWGLHEMGAARSAGDRRITIGALPFGGSVLLASVLESFVASHPNTDVKIINEGAAEMMKRLRAGDVDFVIGLVQETVAEGLANEAFAQTPYKVVARRQHRLHQKDKITIDDLLGSEWVIATSGASRRACYERIFSGGPYPRAAIETCALAIIRRLLARSDRLTLMTSYELMHEDQSLAALAYGPIEPAPLIGITTRTGWLPTQTHLDFIDLLRRHMTAAPAALAASGAGMPMETRARTAPARLRA